MLVAKILVIDDDHSVCEMIASSLKLEGFEALQAFDGVEGVEAARRHAPDLIICDILMPNLDGFDTLKALRDDPATATIPFVFLTGQGTKANLRQGMELGADDFLTKPVMIPELVAAIHTRLQKRQLLLQETERKLDEFRVNLSLSLPHEIRTPLSGIIGFAEVLRDDGSTLQPREISEMATIILKSATRLGHLVENFLTYAQLQILAASPNKKAFVGKEITMMLNLHIEEIAEKKAKEYERPQDIHLKLEGAEAAISIQTIKRIVEEIVDNAFKFSRPGTPINLTTQQADHLWIMIVQDRGSGMDAKYIAQIGAYKQFERKTREQQGSGLGLAIAKTMTELYGGTFSIKSEVGTGTTVTVQLPT